jgi:hypothetical protein
MSMSFRFNCRYYNAGLQRFGLAESTVQNGRQAESIRMLLVVNGD